MYSTKRYNDKMEAFGGKYPCIAVSEKYKDVKEPPPDRWKGKQIEAQYPRKPAANRDGTFDYLALQRLDESRKQGTNLKGGFVPWCDPAKREKLRDVYDDSNRSKGEGIKKGFGTGARNSPDEFTNQIRTERYRELLNKESKQLKKPELPEEPEDEESQKIMRESLWKTTNTEIGRGIQELPLEKPKYGLNSSIKHFYDFGHID
eukprot:gb/GECG01002604.1/.p1 GENE.gb/GECG01002604.1/~~gb/GECG01002604.1/.p1  ORF type:complete len:204 (+),score=34.79 gb/GECG01002604.1/:1-612(+)